MKETLPSSFRDPAGFLFYDEGTLYRQVNSVYRSDYELLMSSGLYKVLIAEGLLVSHKEVELKNQDDSGVYKILKPELIPFISYSYEWSFSQLKDAALLSLQIQTIALKHGMTLKDCTASNVQFRNGKPIFIDTLSFEKKSAGQPWNAYRQFCQHFLAPLCLMSLKDIRLSQLLRIYPDGIPLDLASSLLPKTSYLNLSILSHIHLHAKSQRFYGSKKIKKKNFNISDKAQIGLVMHLQSTINNLIWHAGGTEWAEYRDTTSYTKESFQHKVEIVSNFLIESKAKTVWDLGANAGEFSKIAASQGKHVIAMDMDPAAVEQNYLSCKSRNELNVLPLLMNLENPSSGIGWANSERQSLMQRGPVDSIMALALLHHLAISNNIPFARVASYFSNFCKTLIIEFVPKTDLQVQKLLSSRMDIFSTYDKHNFEKEFSEFFTIKKCLPIKGSERFIYWMDKKIK